MVAWVTGVHLAVLRGRALRDDALHLQELVGLVTPDDGEPEAHAALVERSGQEAALQLGGVPGEQGLLCGPRDTQRDTQRKRHPETQRERDPESQRERDPETQRRAGTGMEERSAGRMICNISCTSFP